MSRTGKGVERGSLFSVAHRVEQEAEILKDIRQNKKNVLFEIEAKAREATEGIRALRKKNR